MAVLRAALPHFNANPEGGAFIITSSVAVRAPFGLPQLTGKVNR